MQPLVTIIVPVYKTEDYLVRCLDSLCRQSLSDIEILLIDDCSPDKCSEICDEYAKQDARFRAFHNQRNLGLSEARNIGIKYATCNYLMFVDSDDWVHKDFCKEAYECAVQYNADLVMFKFKRLSKQNKLEHIMFNKYNANFMQSNYKTREEAIDFLKECGNYAWNKLYRKELFRNISYPPGYLYEDVGTTYKLVWNATRIYYLNKELYYYCYRADSITSLNAEKSLNNLLELTLQQYNDLIAWGYPSEKLEGLLEPIALSYCIKKKKVFFDKRYACCEKILLESKSIPVNLTKKQKVLFFLFKYCRPVFELICNLFNKKLF